MIRLYDIDIDMLIDLQHRLVKDYNGDEEFEQYEEDRLEVSKVINYLTCQKLSPKKRLYSKYYNLVYLDGYKYLEFIIENYDGGVLDIMTLYDTIGRRFGKSGSVVERAIRTFRGYADEQVKTPSKTNKEFIMKNIIELCD